MAEQIFQRLDVRSPGCVPDLFSYDLRNGDLNRRTLELTGQQDILHCIIRRARPSQVKYHILPGVGWHQLYVYIVYPCSSCHNGQFMCYNGQFMCYNVKFVCYNGQFMHYNGQFMCYTVKFVCYNVHFMRYNGQFVRFTSVVHVSY